MAAFLVFGSGCAAHEPATVKRVSAPKLKCSMDEIDTELNRQTPKVREYLAGCDFMYTRIHCTDDGCYQASPAPPCIGEMECFVEDPITLKWVLPDEPGKSASR